MAGRISVENLRRSETAFPLMGEYQELFLQHTLSLACMFVRERVSFLHDSRWRTKHGLLKECREISRGKHGYPARAWRFYKNLHAIFKDS